MLLQRNPPSSPSLTTLTPTHHPHHHLPLARSHDTRSLSTKFLSLRGWNEGVLNVKSLVQMPTRTGRSRCCSGDRAGHSSHCSGWDTAGVLGRGAPRGDALADWWRCSKLHAEKNINYICSSCQSLLALFQSTLKSHGMSNHLPFFKAMTLSFFGRLT